jgi:hypothetical protein
MTRHACCTGVLRHPRRPFFHAPADASTTPAAGYNHYLVALDGRVGSAVIDQLLQHHGLDSLTVTDWVANSGASNHTSLDASNLTSVHPPTSTDPSSIIVGNISALPVTSVGDPFYLNNVLITTDIIQKNICSLFHY